MGAALAPADLARAPDLPCPQAGLRRLPGRRLVPVVRPRPHRRGDGRQARQVRPVLVTQAPQWLQDLAASAVTMEVPRIVRPPATGGRRSAVLVLFGEGPA